jgi:hypothetical protein
MMRLQGRMRIIRRVTAELIGTAMLLAAVVAERSGDRAYLDWSRMRDVW